MRFLLLFAVLALAAPLGVVSARDYPPGEPIYAWAAGVCHQYEVGEDGLTRFVGICGFETREPERETTRETTRRPTAPGPAPETETTVPGPAPGPEPTAPGPAPEPPPKRVEWNGVFMDQSEFLCFQDNARNVFHDTLESTGCAGA